MDYISREAAESVFRNARKSLNAQKHDYMANEYLTRDTMLLNAEQIIHALPSAVVRCKDCKYGTRLVVDLVGNKGVVCCHGNINRALNWFCADGEKKR